jgi:hypothetical protein
MEKIRVGGIKLSPELTLIRQSFDTSDSGHVRPVYRILSEKRMNILHATSFFRENRFYLSCLAAAEDVDRIRHHLGGLPAGKDRIEIIPGMGILSVFPHQGRFDILGLSLTVFGKAGIPLHGYSSSISLLAFVIDHNRLGEAADALRGHFELPRHHSPFHSRVAFVEERK